MDGSDFPKKPKATPLIQWDDTQKAMMSQFSYGGYEAPKEEYEGHVVGAVARQVNIVAAGEKKAEYNNKTYDLTGYDDVEFSRSSIRKQLTDQGTDPMVIDEVLQSDDLDDWHAVEARKAYLESYYRDQRQMAEKLNTAGAIALSIPFAIADPSTLVLAPISGGLSVAAKAAKVTNFATKLGRAAPVLQYGAAGAIEGLASEYLYQQTTGVYEDDAMINSALFGAAIGGGLGVLVGRGPKQNLTSFEDTATGAPVPAVLAKEKKLANAETQLEEITALVDELSTVGNNRYADEAAESFEADRVATIQRSQSELESVKVERVAIQRELDELGDARSAQKQSRETVSGNLAKVTDIRRTLDETDKALATAEGLRDAVATREVSGDLTKVLKGEPRVAAIMDEINTTYKGSVKDFLKSTSNQRMLTRVINDHIENLKAKAEKAKASPLAKLVGEDTSVVGKGLEEADASLKGLDQQERLLKERLDQAKKREDELSRTVATQSIPDKQVALSDKTVELRELANKYNVDPSDPSTLRAFSEKYQSIKADINRMVEGDYKGLDDVYGVLEKKENFVAKLHNELEDVAVRTEDFRMSENFKRLPAWTQKIMISPVENLFASANDMVVGFTNKLHAGTVHHGKANTHNAWNIRKQLDAYQNLTVRNIKAAWRQAKDEGSYSGSLSEWFEDVGKETFASTGAMQRRAYADGNGGADWQVVLEDARKRVNGAAREYRTDNVHLQKAVDATLDYYEGIYKRGNELEMDAFQGTLGKAYVNRIYSREAIEKVGRENAIKQLTTAQEKFAIATNKPWGQAELDDAVLMATGAVDAALDPAHISRTITEPLGVNKSGTTSVFKQRTIDAFDDDIAELLTTDVEALTSLYSFKTHGRLALQQTIGASDENIIEELIKGLGATTKETDNLRVIIETIRGIREIDKNPSAPISRVTKAASTYSSAMHSMAFGLPTITEISAVAGEFGLRKTLSNMIGNPREIYSMYRNGKPSDKNAVELMVSYGDAHFNNRANRYDADTGFDSVGKLQSVLDRAAHGASLLGGLLPITDGLRIMTSSLTVDFLAQMSVKANIGKADMKRLLDMGFDEADLGRIRDTLKVDKDGRITNMDRATWGELDNDINLAVQTTLDRTILEPNGITLPKIMTHYEGGAVIPRIFGKFLRFPIESIERMTYRGMQTVDAKRAMGFASNVALWSLILSGKDAMRDDDKKMYSDNDGEFYKGLLTDALLYSSMVGGVATIADTATGVLTGKNLTNDYSYRFGGVVLSDWNKAQNFARGLATGDADTISRGPTFHVPFKTVNIGEATAAALSTIGLIEETNK